MPANGITADDCASNLKRFALQLPEDEAWSQLPVRGFGLLKPTRSMIKCTEVKQWWNRGPMTTGEFRTVLSVRMLGSLVVTLNGTVVDTVSSRRTRQVFAYLLLHRRVAVPRDVLMDTFWPTASPEAARNNLHVALSGVRQALRAASPVSVLQRRLDTYQLGADLTWVDVEEFEQHCADGHRATRAGDTATAVRCYSAADRLYEGDLLAEDPYLDWASQQREALRLEVLRAQRRLAQL